MATNTITALGAGSGIDVKALAQSLVDAEKSPAKALIDKKVAQSTANISGYSAIKFVLDGLKTALSELKNQSSFNSIAPTNSHPSALSVAAGASSATGSHTVSVTQLATSQRSISAGFATISTPINGGTAFSLAFSLNGASPATDIAVTDTTPLGVAAAINSAGLGVTAQIVNTGDAAAPYKIMVTGATGEASNFRLTSDSTGLAFGVMAGQTAGDARLTVNGMSVTSSSNSVKDAISGATLNLTTLTSTTATLNFTRDTSSVKSKVQAVVSAYNDAMSMLGVVSDPKSSVASYGASLVGNSTVSQIRNQLRAIVMGPSSSPSGTLKYLSDLGVSTDSNTGQLILDSAKLDNVLSTKFESVVTMFSANRENLSTFSTWTAGVAGDGVKKLTALLATTGTLSTESAQATTKISTYAKDLAKLEARMTSLLARYNQQFAAMDAIVGKTTALRTSLTSTFASMLKTGSSDN
jgi:flagellar hook-associated protein 2